MILPLTLLVFVGIYLFYFAKSTRAAQLLILFELGLAYDLATHFLDATWRYHAVIQSLTVCLGVAAVVMLVSQLILDTVTDSLEQL